VNLGSTNASHEEERDGHQQADVAADRLYGEERMAQALGQRQREQHDPRDHAQYQPEGGGVGRVADEAQAASQPV